MLKVITFDLWDTVIRDDSDEPKRAARGLPPKREARRQIVWKVLDRDAALPREQLEVAYDAMEAAFQHVWHEQHVTWTVGERLDVLCTGLNRELPATTRDAVIAELEEMEVTVAPDPVEDMAQAIETLARRYRLGVVSDAIYTPGRCLRHWLEMHCLAHHFRAFAFSDEIGHSKPHHDMFAKIAHELEVEMHEMLHIGDRDPNDVKGPQALGMKAILFTGSRDRDRDATSAEAVCEHPAELPAAVEWLDTVSRP